MKTTWPGTNCRCVEAAGTLDGRDVVEPHLASGRGQRSAQSECTLPSAVRVLLNQRRVDLPGQHGIDVRLDRQSLERSDPWSDFEDSAIRETAGKFRWRAALLGHQSERWFRRVWSSHYRHRTLPEEVGSKQTAVGTSSKSWSFGVRRQSEAATALWIGEPEATTYPKRRLPMKRAC